MSDLVADLIGSIERPVAPPLGFSDALLHSLLEGTSSPSVPHRVVRWVRTRPTIAWSAVAIAAAVIAGLALVTPNETVPQRVTTRPAHKPETPNTSVLTTNPTAPVLVPGLTPGAPNGLGPRQPPSPAGPAPAPSNGSSAPLTPATDGANRVVYVAPSSSGNDTDLWIMDLTTRATKRLTSGAGNDQMPDWSPDGRRVVFARDGSLFLVNDDGTGLRQLTASGTPGSTGHAYPAWSPRGDRILFVAGTQQRTCLKLNCTDIYTIPVEGGSVTDLTTGSMPSWSPDGGHILFGDLTGNGCASTYAQACDATLFVADADGTNRQSLGLTGSVPKYSPDGTRIAYQRGEGNNADIHVARSDGTGDAVIVSGLSDDTQPAWSGEGYGLVFRDASATSGAFGLYRCDERGGSRLLLAASGEQPSVRRVSPRQ
jgi:Tol biopolymer transport system component